MSVTIKLSSWLQFTCAEMAKPIQTCHQLFLTNIRHQHTYAQLTQVILQY